MGRGVALVIRRGSVVGPLAVSTLPGPHGPCGGSSSRGGSHCGTVDAGVVGLALLRRHLMLGAMQSLELGGELPLKFIAMAGIGLPVVVTTAQIVAMGEIGVGSGVGLRGLTILSKLGLQVVPIDAVVVGGAAQLHRRNVDMLVFVPGLEFGLLPGDLATGPRHRLQEFSIGLVLAHDAGEVRKRIALAMAAHDGLGLTGVPVVGVIVAIATHTVLVGHGPRRRWAPLTIRAARSTHFFDGLDTEDRKTRSENGHDTLDQRKARRRHLSIIFHNEA